MDYEITGTTMESLNIILDDGETLLAEAGGLVSMSANMRMDTNVQGGLLGGLKRMVSGATFAFVTFTAQGGKGRATFAPDLPGKVLPMKLGQGENLIAQKNAFLCGQSTIDFDIHFQQRILGGLFGGEGFVLQRLTGPGIAFIEIDGELIERTLAAGERIRVATGHVAAFEPTVDFSVERVAGPKDWLFAGEGLFLTSLTGPGKIWLQTLPFSSLLNKINAALPARSGSSGNRPR